MNESTQEAAPRESLNATAGDAALIRTVVRQYREKLLSLKSNPKGMTHGEVQAHLAACDRILG